MWREQVENSVTISHTATFSRVVKHQWADLFSLSAASWAKPMFVCVCMYVCAHTRECLWRNLVPLNMTAPGTTHPEVWNADWRERTTKQDRNKAGQKQRPYFLSGQDTLPHNVPLPLSNKAHILLTGMSYVCCNSVHIVVENWLSNESWTRNGWAHLSHISGSHYIIAMIL